MIRKKAHPPVVTPSGGNVFDDLGLRNADDLLTKARSAAVKRASAMTRGGRTRRRGKSAREPRR